jgi:hypothetical protein
VNPCGYEPTWLILIEAMDDKERCDAFVALWTKWPVEMECSMHVAANLVPEGKGKWTT